MLDNENIHQATENENANETVNENVNDSAAQSASESLASDYAYAPSEVKRPPVRPLPPENILAGTLGAVLLSLVGSLLFVILYQAGRISAFCGYLITFLAIKGYNIFGKRENVRGIVIAGVVSLVNAIVTEYIAFSFAMYQYGYLDLGTSRKVQFYEAPFETFRFLSENTDYISSLLTEYIIVIAFAAVGIGIMLRHTFIAEKQRRMANANRQAKNI